MTRLHLTGDQSQSLVTREDWASGPLPTQEMEQQAYRLFCLENVPWLWDRVLSGTRNEYRERIWRATTTETSSIAAPRGDDRDGSEAGE